jgi:manganese/iron transport system ATP-binding protein/manganese/zinc/iron transport system ATP- binding protein
MKHQFVIKDLTVAYQRVPAIHHLDLVLSCGHRVALLGPNGAGKTSFLKALVGLVPVTTGSVSFGGHGTTPAAAEIAYLPQRNTVDWDFPVTVRGLVEMGRYAQTSWWRPFQKKDAAAVDHALEAIDLREQAGRQISALSGGQQQRAFIARAFAQNAHVFLLDEPFTGLDRPAQELLSTTLRRLSEAGNLVIAAHHDLKTVPELFDQVIFLNGELIAFGETAEVFTEENIARTFRTHVFSGAVHSLGT